MNTKLIKKEMGIFSRYNRFVSSIEQNITDIFKHFYGINLTLRELSNLFSIGAICYLYFLVNYSLSIDDEFAATRKGAEVWLGQGRWTTFLIEKYFFKQPAIPFSPYLLLILCLVFSYALLIRAHGLSPSWKTYLAFPIFVAFPTWWFMAEFYANVPAAGVGFFAASLASYYTFLHFKKSENTILCKIKSTLVIATLLAIAVGAYQSTLLLYLSSVFGILLMLDIKSNASFRYLIRRFFSRVLFAGVASGAGLIFYIVINFIFQKAMHVQNSEYIKSFINFENFSHPLLLVAQVASRALSYYSGSHGFYGRSIKMAGVFALLTTVVIFFNVRKTNVISIFSWIAVVSIPFAFHLLAGADVMPVRSMIALPYVTWLMVIILMSWPNKTLAFAATIFCLVFNLQIFNLTSEYNAAATITQEHDRMLAADIYRRIGELSKDFDINSEVQIDIFGHQNVNLVYANGYGSATQGSFFDWDGGNVYRIVNFMTVIGFKNIVVMSEADRKNAAPLFKSMSVWPAVGAVIKDGNHYLVKLSKEPDPFHKMLGFE